MVEALNDLEAQGQNPDPLQLIDKLNSLETDQEKYTFLHGLFLEEADVDEIILSLDLDEKIDLTRRLTKLKATLEGYKEYLKEDPEQTDECTGGFKKRLNKVLEVYANPESKKELSPKEIKKYLREMKKRFDELPELHEGIEWMEVEKSLRADPESLLKLHAFDRKGHKMNVFGEHRGAFVFVSAWYDYEEIDDDHRNICFNPDAQKIAEDNGNKPHGNAISIIADIMGVDEDKAHNYLADPKFHTQLIKVIQVEGWAFLRTDAVTRKDGFVIGGDNDGFDRDNANVHYVDGSFRVALRVKKA